MATSLRNGRRRGSTATPTGEADTARLAASTPALGNSSDVQAASLLKRVDVVESRSEMPLRRDPARPAGNRHAHEEQNARRNDAGTSEPRARTLQGCIDEANARVIRGWAWDSGTPGERIRLELVEHNTPLLTALASDNRPGLTLSEIGDGR